MNNTSKSASGCPYVGEPTSLKPNDLTYNDYLQVPALLNLQHPLSEPNHHDEMLFIIIHQAYELWFKLILHEMESAVEFMQKGAVLRAHHLMSRIGAIMKLLVQQIHILETMTPADFLVFRDHLRPASGFQSAQFREVEFLAGAKDEKYLEYFKNRPDMVDRLKARLAGPDIRSSYYGLLKRLGYGIPDQADLLEDQNSADAKLAIVEGLLPIYQRPSDQLPVYLLSESLVDFDQYLALWREHHLRVVERVIGSKPGTGGSEGVAYLRSTTVKKCFPLLWQVRSHLGETKQV
ncbi:MAG: tryptophan 2,3-dioxygenase [Bdellovibrio sp.]|nr:tryptophan 2,3-dioxygenase [Bdellovibrio sp.]